MRNSSIIDRQNFSTVDFVHVTTPSTGNVWTNGEMYCFVTFSFVFLCGSLSFVRRTNGSNARNAPQ